MAREIGSAPHVAFCHFQLCFCLGTQGYADLSISHGKEALAISEEAEHKQWAAAARCALGAAYDDFLQSEPAVDLLQNGIDRFEGARHLEIRELRAQPIPQRRERGR